ncbi:MAG: hypothetical protein NVSMB57_14270 [Actinomycetota bacterium]
MGAMKKGSVFVIDFDAASAAEHTSTLEAAGWQAESESVDGAIAWQRIFESPPDVVVIDLTRLPSHGREAGRAVRIHASLSQIPIVFVGGSSEARSKALGVVPGALHCNVDALQETLSSLSRARR